MKLFIATSIKEDLKAVSSIMEKAGVMIFSVSEIIGHKTEHHDYLPDNWFGKSDDETDALLFFSFTDNDKANYALHLVKEYNAANKSNFPIRAFISPVEQSSY